MRERYKVVALNAGSSPRGHKHKKNYGICDKMFPLETGLGPPWYSRKKHTSKLIQQGIETREEAQRECDRLNEMNLRNKGG